MFEQFDESARCVLVAATVQARERRAAAAGTENLLTAIATDETTPVGRCLDALGVRAGQAAAWQPADEGEPHDHSPSPGTLVSYSASLRSSPRIVRSWYQSFIY